MDDPFTNLSLTEFELKAGSNSLPVSYKIAAFFTLLCKTWSIMYKILNIDLDHGL